jgi:imidazolonepropionase-like amidohydrolase
VLLRGIPVFDGFEPLGPCDVEWQGDQVVRVEPGVRPGPWGDLCLLPGLIDTHVHLLGYAGTEPVDYLTWHLVTPLSERVLHGASHAQRAFKAGVTTLRDMAGGEGQISLRRAFEMDLLCGPRLKVHGLVGMTGGHGDLFTPPFAPVREPTADGPDACRRLVRTFARMGADGIKITTSGGVLSTGDRSEWRNYTPAEIEAIVDEAHALGMPVAAHAHTPQGIQAALDAGVDSLEHATLLTSEQARVCAQRGLPVAPTLLILRRIVEGKGTAPAESRRKAEALYAQRHDRLREARRLGVRLVLGTDANGVHMPFGLEMDEVQEMARELDLSPVEALRAATAYAAQAVGEGHRLGRVARGYAADLLVMQGRPWEELRHLSPQNLKAVVAKGRVVHGSLEEAS